MNIVLATKNLTGYTIKSLTQTENEMISPFKIKDFHLIEINPLASDMVAEYIENNIEINIVGYESGEIKPAHLKINMDPNSIETIRTVNLSRAFHILTPIYNAINSICTFRFTCINNKLCSKGYFVHDDNKEEVYLDILETGDEDLINDLEEYLNHRETLQNASFLDLEFKTLETKINEMTSQQEIENEVGEFIKKAREFWQTKNAK